VTYTIGGGCGPTFQSSKSIAVLVPESFRGGCSFGVTATDGPEGRSADINLSRAVEAITSTSVVNVIAKYNNS
jgi:hypothetical protein